MLGFCSEVKKKYIYLTVFVKLTVKPLFLMYILKQKKIKKKFNIKHRMLTNKTNF